METLDEIEHNNCPRNVNFDRPSLFWHMAQNQAPTSR
jgi:hypothetical protein